MRIIDIIKKTTLRYNFTFGFICGFLSAMIFAPTYATFFLITLSFFLYQITIAEKMRQVLLFAFGFAFSHFAVSLMWVMNAYTVFGNNDLELLSGLVPVFFGLWGSLFIVPVACITYKTPGLYKKWICFAAAWSLFEWIRSWLFTGFPWNILSTALAFDLNIMQSISLFGVYGLSFFVVLCSSSLALLPKTKPVIISLIIAASFYGFGYKRLYDNPTYYVEKSPYIRIVQPNLSLAEKNKNRENALHEHINLSRIEDTKKEITHVIWPESAYPYWLDEEDTFYYSFLISALNRDGTLITGGDRKETKNGISKLYNSIVAIDDLGQSFITYDKSHLVPFGEYVPLKEYMPSFIRKIADGFTDFSKGEGLKTYNLYKAPPFAPLICFEVIFSGRVKDDEFRPSWFVNISNDAWYGKSEGPYQHLVNAQLRAIEEGIPVIRAANTGISAVIDAYGRIVDKIDLDKKGYINTKIPVATLFPPLFGEYGNYIPVTFTATILIIILMLSLYEKRAKNHIND